MQIGAAPAPLPRPAHLAQALSGAAGRLGHRPAVTVLHGDRREEQGFASLAQWAAKGAHLLELDLQLEPGDRVTLVGPPGWLPVAVALACWCTGIAVTTEPADVAVVHESLPAPTARETLWLGDAVDGSPVTDVTGEAWAVAVQAFPDQPPLPRATPDAPAFVTPGRTWTQAELIDEAAGWGESGTLGIEAPGPLPLPHWLAATAVRPLLTGRPTVLLRGAARQAAAAEGVDRWLA